MQVTQLPAHTLHHVNRNGIQNRRRAQPQKITRSVSDSPSFFFDFGAFGGHEAPHRAPTVITEEPETSLATTSTSCRVHAYERAKDIASSFAAAAPLRESGRITTGSRAHIDYPAFPLLKQVPKFWFLSRPDFCGP